MINSCDLVKTNTPTMTIIYMTIMMILRSPVAMCYGKPQFCIATTISLQIVSDQLLLSFVLSMLRDAHEASITESFCPRNAEWHVAGM